MDLTKEILDGFEYYFVILLYSAQLNRDYMIKSKTSMASGGGGVECIYFALLDYILDR